MMSATSENDQDGPTNPVHAEVKALQISSMVAVAGHPIHAMLVHFPIVLVLSTLGADLFFWWSGDPFWARAALWAAGVGFGFGILASLAGTAELLLVEGIRRRAASWTHAIAAMMLIAIAGANWGVRLEDPVDAVLPLGLFLSALGSLFVALAGYHGGKLVFDHGIGTMIGAND
jgi:uncharacterized membrane protein